MLVPKWRHTPRSSRRENWMGGPRKSLAPAAALIVATSLFTSGAGLARADTACPDAQCCRSPLPPREGSCLVPPVIVRLPPGGFFCGLGGLFGLPCPATPWISTLSRPADPIVLRGRDAPEILSQRIPASELAAYRYGAGAWNRIPVQVDERDKVFYDVVYRSEEPPAHAPSPPDNPASHDPDGDVCFVDYVASGTVPAVDEVSTIDHNDEIVFMAKDAGPCGVRAVEPQGVVRNSGVVVTVWDELDGSVGCVYLFRHPAPPQLPGYVDYSFNLTSGDYLSTYDHRRGGNVSNPEGSTVETSIYRRGWEDRMITNELSIVEPPATGVNLLKFAGGDFGAARCPMGPLQPLPRNGPGGFIVNKGALSEHRASVRAIRSTVGNFGFPFLQAQNVFYERREDSTIISRISSQIAGIVPRGRNIVALTEAARGMRYYSDLGPVQGYEIDGVDDAPGTSGLTGALPQWELFTGEQGTITKIIRVDTNVHCGGCCASSECEEFDDTYEGFYCDDAEDLGTSGLNWEAHHLDTDPSAEEANHWCGMAVLYYDRPLDMLTDGQRVGYAELRHLWVTNPLCTSVSRYEPAQPPEPPERDCADSLSTGCDGTCGSGQCTSVGGRCSNDPARSCRTGFDCETPPGPTGATVNTVRPGVQKCIFECACDEGPPDPDISCGNSWPMCGGECPTRAFFCDDRESSGTCTCHRYPFRYDDARGPADPGP